MAEAGRVRGRKAVSGEAASAATGSTPAAVGETDPAATGRKARGRHRERVLTAVQVRSLGPGFHSDGAGLYLLVDPSGARRWVLRIMVGGKRRDIGLGGTSYVTLAEARAKAQAMRATARAGGDPVEGRRQRLGGTTSAEVARKPELTLSGLLDLYWTLAADKTQGKSEDQIRRWRNPRVKAFKNIIDVIGDRPLSGITADDLLDFRGWWWTKITEEGLTPNSANRDFKSVASTIRLVNQAKRLGLKLDLSGLNFAEGAKTTRLAFSESWIKDVILAPGALDGLNTEARCILLGMINTGYRPSEAQGLLPEHISLDCEHPHISIEPVGRTLKNHSSRRIIPLAGVSLQAFRECPDGFPRYRGKAGFTATVNKFMRENGLTETPDHTLYGLRHSFEDRLLDRDVDERIRRDLMGHSLTRERHGKGASLEKLAAIVQAIAL